MSFIEKILKIKAEKMKNKKYKKHYLGKDFKPQFRKKK